MQRAGSLIGKLRLPKGADSPEQRAIAAWKIAAGKKVAKHTRATRLVRTTLMVEVGDIIWQRQLNTLRHFLLRNMAELLGAGMITDFDFRPIPARRGPGMAQSALPGAADLGGPLYDSKERLEQPWAASRISGGRPTEQTDEAAAIRDPVMALLYRQARSKRGA